MAPYPLSALSRILLFLPSRPSPSGSLGSMKV